MALLEEAVEINKKANMTAAERAQIAKVESDIATLNTQMKTLRAENV